MTASERIREARLREEITYRQHEWAGARGQQRRQGMDEAELTKRLGYALDSALLKLDPDEAKRIARYFGLGKWSGEWHVIAAIGQTPGSRQASEDASQRVEPQERS